MTSVSVPKIGESYTTAGGRTAYRVEPSRYGPSILATNLAREKKARQPRKEKQAPVLLTAWQRGEALLSRGYTVEPMPQYLCYEVTGGTAPYHVCLDATSTAYGCSCPDGIMRGDKRPCKHSLACMVSLWQWAEADYAIAKGSIRLPLDGVSVRYGTGLGPLPNRYTSITRKNMTYQSFLDSFNTPKTV